MQIGVEDIAEGWMVVGSYHWVYIYLTAVKKKKITFYVIRVHVEVYTCTIYRFFVDMLK